MKHLVSMIFLIGITNFSCLEAQKKEIDVDFLQLKPEYKKRDGFSFGIQNKTSDTVFYYIGLQAFFSNEWHEVLDDIDPKAPIMGAVLKKMSPNSLAQISYGVSSYFSDNPERQVNRNINITSYRFVLNFQKKNSENFHQRFSNKFIVN